MVLLQIRKCLAHELYHQITKRIERCIYEIVIQLGAVHDFVEVINIYGVVLFVRSRLVNFFFETLFFFLNDKLELPQQERLHLILNL